MAVFQPLYFAGGRYTANTDRKLLAALFGSESDGTRVTGVIPSNQGTNSMKVSVSSGTTLSIATGLCVIPDSTSQSSTSPSLYLAGVDTTAETLSMGTSGTGANYLIYARVDETPFSITNKALTSNVATLTTGTTAHGFNVGETVVISGVDDIFDGTYSITAVTNYTFSYAKTHADVSSTSVLASVTKESSGTTYASNTFNVSSKAIDSNNIATIVLTANHNFSTGDRVIIRGIDPTLDGTHTLLSTTSGTNTLTFLVAKVVVASYTTASVPINYLAVARVPFAIRALTPSTSAPSVPYIKLATADISSTAITNLKDIRQYVNTTGGVQFYDSNNATVLKPGDSTSVGDNGKAFTGRLRFDTATSKLEIYDASSSKTDGNGKWRQIYSLATDHHDVLATNYSASAIHHTLGTTANEAAKGNHTHGIVMSGYTNPALSYAYNSNVDSGANPVTSNITITSTAQKTIISRSFTLAANSSIVGYAIGTCSVYIAGSATVYLGIDDNKGSAVDSAYIDISGATGTVPATVVRQLSYTNTTSSPITITITLYGKLSGSYSGYYANVSNLVFIPFTPMTTLQTT